MKKIFTFYVLLFLGCSSESVSTDNYYTDLVVNINSGVDYAFINGVNVTNGQIFETSTAVDVVFSCRYDNAGTATDYKITCSVSDSHTRVVFSSGHIELF